MAEGWAETTRYVGRQVGGGGGCRGLSGAGVCSGGEEGGGGVEGRGGRGLGMKKRGGAEGRFGAGCPLLWGLRCVFYVCVDKCVFSKCVCVDKCDFVWVGERQWVGAVTYIRSKICV